MAADGFTTSHVARIGIKRERLKIWMSKGCISPSIRSADGAGTSNRFSRFDLYMLKLFDRLIRHGYSRKEAGERISEVRAADSEAAIVECTFIAFHRKSEMFSLYPSTLLFGLHQTDVTPFTVGYLEQFDDVYIVNFHKLREVVDRAIGG